MTCGLLGMSPLIRNGALTDLGQFGGFVAVLIIGAPLSILGWAVPLAKSGGWTPQVRRQFLTRALVVSLVPLAMCVYAMRFRCTDPATPGTDLMILPVYAATLVEFIAAVVFVRLAKSIRLIAASAAVIPLAATLYAGFVSVCLIGGSGP
jgi:hypothetical protein